VAIADWVISKSNDDLSISLEIDAPISGTGSLRLSNENIASTVGVAMVHLRPVAGNPQSQFVKGRIRTLIKPVAFTDTDNTRSFFGILSMMNQENVWDIGGKAYFAGRWGGDTPMWVISRMDSGLAAESFTHLAQGTVVNIPGLDDVRATEFEWIYDPLEFSGVRLTLKASADDKFTNMVTIYQVVDTTGNHLNSTVGEGLFLAPLHESVGPEVTVLFDNTSNYELVSA
jgi:hypothetical protein